MTESRSRPLEALRASARRLPGGMTAGRWLRRLIDPDLRAVARSQRINGEALFQPFPDTWDERYPALFDALAARLAVIEAPRVLSFGCSTGAEVRALRRRLPRARITGVDANPRAIARARRLGIDPLTHWRVANRLGPDERYDAILALAVFRHGALEAQRPDTCAAILPFARFERGAAMLGAALEPGGWLAICNAHFRFGDTAFAAGYDAEPLRLADLAPGPLYGADDRRIADDGDLPVLFRKR